MVLSQRERYIAYGLGGALVLLVLNFVVLDPLLAWDAQLTDDEKAVQAQQQKDSDLFLREHNLRNVWAEMTKGGLRNDPSEAESQLEHAMADWAQDSGVTIVSQRPERPAEKNGFVQIAFQATGNGTSATIAKLMWRIESAPIPVRIDDLQLTAKNEGGSDELQFQLKMSTLSSSSDVIHPPANGAGQTTSLLASGNGGSSS